jgi:hypothetical protein
MKHHANEPSTLVEPPRRLTRKQAHKWVGTKETPKYLRHVGVDYASLRAPAPETIAFSTPSKTRH